MFHTEGVFSEEPKGVSREPKSVLHRTMVELIPDKRLVIGPALSAKRNYSIKDMLIDFGINCFVNLMPDRGKCRWYMNVQQESLIMDLEKFTDDNGPRVRCLSFPMDSETPTKDPKLFAFITKLYNILQKNPLVKMYIHDGSGTHVAASVALPLWYFIQKNDPIQAIKRMGKHHVIPDRKKAFVQQIRRMYTLHDTSIHRHLFTPPKKKKKTEEEPPPEKIRKITTSTFVSSLSEEQQQKRKSTFEL